MKLKNRMGAAVAALAMMAVVVAPSFAAGELTVGDFVKRFAAFKQVDATSLETAVQALGTVGIRIPANLDYSKRLTEADVARISRAAGLDVRTSNPDTGFGSDQVERFFLSFGDELGQPIGGAIGTADAPGNGNENGTGPSFDPFTKGKAGGKGKGKFSQTPTDPD